MRYSFLMSAKLDLNAFTTLRLDVTLVGGIICQEGGNILVAVIIMLNYYNYVHVLNKVVANGDLCIDNVTWCQE